MNSYPEILQPTDISIGLCMLEIINNNINDIESEYKKLAKVRKQYKETEDKIKNMVIDLMVKEKKNKMKVGNYLFELKLNPVSVVITDKDKIPDEYMREKIIKEPDKVKIKKFYKEHNYEKGIAGTDTDKTYKLKYEYLPENDYALDDDLPF